MLLYRDAKAIQYRTPSDTIKVIIMGCCSNAIEIVGDVFDGIWK